MDFALRHAQFRRFFPYSYFMKAVYGGKQKLVQVIPAGLKDSRITQVFDSIDLKMMYGPVLGIPKAMPQ